MTRERARRAQRTAGSVRLDAPSALALLALAAFLATAFHAPLHRLAHADGARAPHACGSARSVLPADAHGAAGEPAPTDPLHSDHDCPLCLLGGLARAPHTVEPFVPPRPDVERAAPRHTERAVPSAALFLAAEPRAPPAA